MPAETARAHSLTVESAPGSGGGVRWIGAQRDVLAGDIRGRVALGDLSAAPHLYGLGPLDGLRGEVSIFDSVPSIARIEESVLVTTTSWDARACFLVWAQVATWSDRVIATEMPGLEPIEDQVVALASEWGFDVDRPLPFRIRGSAISTTLHVLDKRDGLPHNSERHEQAKVRRTLERTAVELVGFYSRHHRAIFTPKEANIHVHLRTEDGRISGHLEAVRLEPGSRLAVPAVGWNQ